MIWLLMILAIALVAVWFLLPAFRPKLIWVALGIAGWIAAASEWIVGVLGGMS